VDPLRKEFALKDKQWNNSETNIVDYNVKGLSCGWREFFI
jgi:hypothetical protein